MKGFVQDIEGLATKNDEFRRVVYTATHCQLVVMALKPKDDEWVKSILDKTATVAGGAWEKYKSAETFDGTTKHPWWLETSSLSG